MGLPRYFWHCFLISGALLLAGALVSGFKTWEKQRSLGRVEGTVIASRADGSLGRDVSTEVKFTTPDGQAHQFATRTAALNKYRAGSKLPVVYDIEDPDNARIDAPGQLPWEGPIVLFVWGSIFVLTGGIPLYLGARKRNDADWLKANGRPIDATFSGVIGNPNLIVNGKSPFRVGAQWNNPETGQLWQFMSGDLWNDPTPQLTSRIIRVLIDPQNAKRYWMDLNFLTKE